MNKQFVTVASTGAFGVAGIAAGIGTKQLVDNIVAATMPASPNLYVKVATHVGAYAVSALVASAATASLLETANQAVTFAQNLNSEVEDVLQTEPTSE